MSEFEPKYGAVMKFQSEKWNQCYLNYTGIFIFISLMISLNGCSSMTLGNDFPVNQVSSIEIGVTTRTEIQERFGAPWRTGIEDGMSTWTFGYYSYDFSGKGLGRDLMIKFIQEGIVRSYSFNTTETEEMPKPDPGN